MNYSIIFTEISFSPETSILLQIIQIIHMTFGIIPESDRKGRAVCQFWLQGGKHDVTPTDKNYLQARVKIKSQMSYELFGLFVTEYHSVSLTLKNTLDLLKICVKISNFPFQ